SPPVGKACPIETVPLWLTSFWPTVSVTVLNNVAILVVASTGGHEAVVVVTDLGGMLLPSSQGSPLFSLMHVVSPVSMLIMVIWISMLPLPFVTVRVTV